MMKQVCRVNFTSYNAHEMSDFIDSDCTEFQKNSLKRYTKCFTKSEIFIERKDPKTFGHYVRFNLIETTSQLIIVFDIKLQKYFDRGL